MHKLRFKLVGYFARVILLSLILSSAIMVLLCARYVDDELLLNQRSLQATARELFDNTPLTADQIAKALSSTDYRLQRAEATALNAEEQAALQDGQTVVTGFFLAKKVYFALGDDRMVAEAVPANTLLIRALLRSLLGNLLLIAMGFVVVSILSRRMAQPIVNLTLATREIARGNFDINVDAQMPRFSGDVKEIAELTNTFNQMAHELKHVDYLRRDFTSNLSHELKSPVASINGYARLLQLDGLSDEARRAYAQAIAGEGARLANLSDSLLKLTRLENQQAPLSTARFSLDELLRRVVTGLHPEIERKRQQISVTLPRVMLDSDEALLNQAFYNLLGNAVKFTGEGGHIALTLAKSRGEARVLIADDGVGMDGATLERIFEKFYQADPSRHIGGSGLGLPLARRIVELLGGSIDVWSEPGSGSRFTVRLPDGAQAKHPSPSVEQAVKTEVPRAD